MGTSPERDRVARECTEAVPEKDAGLAENRLGTDQRSEPRRSFLTDDAGRRRSLRRSHGRGGPRPSCRGNERKGRPRRCRSSRPRGSAAGWPRNRPSPSQLCPLGCSCSRCEWSRGDFRFRSRSSLEFAASDYCPSSRPTSRATTPGVCSPWSSALRGRRFLVVSRYGWCSAALGHHNWCSYGYQRRKVWVSL